MSVPRKHKYKFGSFFAVEILGAKSHTLTLYSIWENVSLSKSKAPVTHCMSADKWIKTFYNHSHTCKHCTCAGTGDTTPLN